MSWKYYNHAAVPTTAPHENVDLSAVKDGSIWEMEGKPLLARWTSDFDCEEETSWWYLVKDTPIILDELSKHSRKHIRQGLNRCDIKVIDNKKYAEEIYDCYNAACIKYDGLLQVESKEDFIRKCKYNTTFIYWGAFEALNNQLIGYLMVKENKDYIEVVTAKFHPDFLNTHVSDALYYKVLNFYLNKAEIKYVSSGQRNINHITNTQEYKIKTLGYRKAYCKLHIKYKKWVKICVFLLYPFRKYIKLGDKNGYIHQINSLLEMEKIVRDK